MSTINIYLITVTVINFILAFIIYFKSPNRRINIFYALAVLSATFWTICMIILRTVGQTNIDSLYFWSILLWVATVPIVLFYLYFCIEFPEGVASKRKRWLTRLMLLIPAAFVLVVNILYFGAFENAFITDGGIGYTLNLTHFYIWALYIIGYFIASFIILFRKLKNAKGITRIQLIYMIYGILPAALFGVIFGILFPLFDNYKYFWLSEGTLIIMSVLIAYAILKHHLLNIKVITTELFSALITIILLVNALSAKTWIEFWPKFALFIGVVIFIILLIRGVLKEVRTREEMQKLAGDLAIANEKLKELDKAKSDFVSIASHQLRTPITAIKGYSSMLLEGSFGEIPEKAKSATEKIFESSNRLIHLIADFLTLSRIERGKIEYNFQKIDLKEIVVSVMDEFKTANAREKKKLDLSLDIDEKEDYNLTLDQEKIRQVIYNIVENAMKYTPNGFIKVSLYKTPDKSKAVLKTQDSGIGMSKESLGKIFQKFGQIIENGKIETTTGVGLGLYVVKEIINAHHGDVRAESEGEGTGSAFYIELPVDFVPPAS